MRIQTFTLITLLSILIANPLTAQLRINEVSAANRNIYTDYFGEHEDWIELFNSGSATIDLTGYYLSDNIDNPTKWAFPAGAAIDPGQYLVIFASGRDGYYFGQWHASFRITQTAEEDAVLADPAGNVIDQFHWEDPNRANHSYGRNAAGDWKIYDQPTPGAVNNTIARNDYTPIPIINLPAGFYTNPLSVSIFGPVGLTIRYTTDGSEPIATSPAYSGPIDISETTVLRARVFSSDPLVLPGLTQTNTYFINVSHTIPVISVAGGELDELLNGSYSSPWGSFELFENGEQIDEAEGEYNKHGNDSWAYGQRGIDYITRDEFGYDDEIEHKVFDNSDREEYQRLILKAAANDNYPAHNNGAHIRDAYAHTLSQRAGLELDERTYKPCVLYANGEYWGVYEIREKVDDSDFTEYYYNQGKYDIDMIKTWGATWIEYGDWADWYTLHNFITTNDMSAQPNYEIVKDQLNVLSLIDYMILNTHVVCKDWLNWNTAWWRGRNPEGEQLKWRYLLWDLDAIFGHYVNYTSIPDVSPNADPCDNEEYSDSSDPQGHVDLIVSLMENEEFHALYVNRYADLNNTYLSCEYMIALLDSMIAVIEPEMYGQVARWGGSYQSWLINVQTIRDFINARCIVINGGIGDCYEVSGPYPLQVRVEPAGFSNKVLVNTIAPDTYPYDAEYFGDIPITLTAQPAQGWELDHWEVANQVFGPDATSDAISLSMIMGDTITAFFAPDVPCASPSTIEIDSTATTISLSWNGPFNTISYIVRWRDAESGQWEAISVLDPEFIIEGLNNCSTYEIEVFSVCGNTVSADVAFSVSTACANSATEPAGLAEVSVYPNPFRDQFTCEIDLMDAGPLKATLLTTAGAVVAQQSWEQLSPGQNMLALELPSSAGAGMYILRLQTERGIYTKRIVKQ
ncbi:MAG: CotH kinase family protein [Saprospiraceae bacterium]|nr:CotH kinase family protein [Saprospiraceae bacterium]